jgi:hypothetical protein
MEVIQFFLYITRTAKISPIGNDWLIWIYEVLLDHGNLISVGVHLGHKYH